MSKTKWIFSSVPPNVLSGKTWSASPARKNNKSKRKSATNWPKLTGTISSLWRPSTCMKKTSPCPLKISMSCRRKVKRRPSMTKCTRNWWNSKKQTASPKRASRGAKHRRKWTLKAIHEWNARFVAIRFLWKSTNSTWNWSSWTPNISISKRVCKNEWLTLLLLLRT